MKNTWRAAILITTLLSISSSIAHAAVEETNAADLYRKASSLVTPLPQNFTERARNIIDHGWVHDEELLTLLAHNQAAIEIFKDATRLSYCQFVTGELLPKDFQY